MGQNYDSNAAFFCGLATGALLGAAFGILFAPRQGSELRGQVAESASNVGDAVSKTVDTWTQRGREAYDRARDAAAQAGEQVNRAAADAAKTAEATLNTVSDKTAAVGRRAEQAAGRI